MKIKMRQNYKYVFFLLGILLFISILAVMPDDGKEHNIGFISTELQLKEKIDNNLTTYTYIDAPGKITVAIDMGYATMEQYKNADPCVLG